MGSKNNGSVYFRADSNVVWIRYVHPVNGKVQTSLSELRRDVLGEDECKRQARIVLDQILADIAAGNIVTHGPMTLGDWFQKRVRTRAEGKKELAMLRRHAPELAKLPLNAVTSIVLGAWAKRQAGAPRSVWHRWSAIRTALRDAMIAGHLTAIPLMPPDSLPVRTDADPTWRARAYFTMEECERMMFDPRVPGHRRVLYALKVLTGMRHGEAVGLRWGDIDWSATPRPAIVVAVQYDGQPTKTLATKVVPMHPALETILTAWRAHLTERDGAAPEGSDRVVTAEGGITFDRYGKANDELAADLLALGMRVQAGQKRGRGGHDMRRTFVTELRRAKVERTVRKSLTHPPAVVRDSIDGYDLVSYEDKCEAISSIRVRTLRVVADAAVTVPGYGPATVLENSSGSNMFAESEDKTVFTSQSYQGQSGSNDSRGLRIVPANSTYLERSGTDLDRSTVAATDRDRRIEAVEAQVRALLDELARLRK